ncbi:MAG TPA: AAA family ATPase [Chitinophagaceae bacterium]|jgi:AAA15 family ATPase/GTPase|nr:AAA family ATPase [Chitinophagaceae bacterium]HMU58523.1 AAA family ATPase [Chitinophagaceae bacterium]
MSHIKNIEIKNFKSIRHSKIEDCRRVNVFIGYPNVGKSNILEALSTFSINNETKSVTDFIRIGKPTTLFFNGNVDEPAEIILNNIFRAKLAHEQFGISANFQIDRYTEGFSKIDTELKAQNFSSRSDIEDKIPSLGRFDISEGNLEVRNFSANDNFRVYQEESKDFLQLSTYKKISLLKYEFRKETIYDSKNSWGLKQPSGKNLFEIIFTKKELGDEISELFKEYNLNFFYDTSSQDYKIMKIIGSSIFTVPFFMTADTLQRLIFHKAAIASNKNSVLLFEEPEAHMFPPYISKFTADVNYDENNNQFFIATHSPFVLNDFMEDMDKENLAIYTVGYRKETGETVVRRITDGEIDEIYQYGIDLFFNLENFLKDAV